MRIITATTLSALSACLLLVQGCKPQQSAHASQQKVAEQQDKVADALVKEGAMSRADFFEIKRIDVKAEAGERLSDADMRFLFGLYKSVKKPYDRKDALRALHISYPLRHAKTEQIPVSYLPQMFSFGVDMVSYKGPMGALVSMGCVVLGRTGDKKALPYLQPLTKSTHWDVRSMAASAIKKIE